MKFEWKLVLVVMIAGLVFSCKPGSDKSKTKEIEPVLLTIGDDEVSVNEFNYVYKKNNSKSGDAYTEKSLKEYLDLYVNFRLKVKQAEDLGYDSTREFLREFSQYEDQLAQPYLTEKSVTEKLIKQVYERLGTEVNASHLLIRFPEDPSPADTIKAYNKIMDFKKQLDGGEDFEVLAFKFSEDPSAKKNKGNLGYFTAMQMVYPFENAAFNTPVGKISNVIRTRFGYHVLKVNNKRPARGEVRISHIMINANDGMNPADISEADKKIKELHAKLVAGGDWKNLCSQFSEDTRTAPNGGLLPWIKTGKVDPNFENAAFGLSKPGDISSPVKSAYGWHILKLEEKKGLESYDKLKGQLKMQVEKDARANLPKAAFIKRVKKENNFEEDVKVKKYALMQGDSSLLQAKWMYNKEDKKLSATIFKIQDKKYTVEQFFKHVAKRQRLKPTANVKGMMERYYGEFINESLLAFERDNLEGKYVDYRLTLKEYRYGILLFKLMDEKVWTKAIKDTTGLKNFFEANKGKYKWEDRYEILTIHAENGGILGNAIKDHKANKYKTFKELKAEYNKEGALHLEVDEGTYELKERPYFESLKGEIGEFRTLYNDRYYYFEVKQKIPAGPKKFDETRGLLISDYQGQLEKEWIDELRSKYKFTVNQVEFDKLVKE